jgi:hypothetical protein
MTATRTFRRIAVVTLLTLAMATGVTSHAATFAPISGTLSIRAGSKPAQFTPAVLGSASLFDTSFPVSQDFASASLQASIPGPSRFDFSASASSTTTRDAPVGQSNAVASVTFHQSFTTAALQWIELNAEVLSPPADAGVLSTISLARAGQAATYSIGDTAGSEVSRQGIFVSGTYVVSGHINTTAVAPPSHAGALSGFLLVASLADFDGDRGVTGADLPTWKIGFGSTSGAFTSGNLDGDGDADGADFLLWQRQLGSNWIFSLSIPEPTTASTAIAAALIAAYFRRPRNAAVNNGYCRTNRSAARRAPISPAR